MATFNASVAASADDCHDHVSFGFVNNSADINTGSLGVGAYYGGFRFTGITVPQGATISSATITIRHRNVVGTSVSGDWHAWDTDDAGQFSGGGDTPRSVTLTTASTTYTKAASGSYATSAQSITSVVQEIVDRGGWSSGNAMNFVLVGSSSGSNLDYIAAYDHSTESPADLDITYTTGGGSSVPVFWHHYNTLGHT